jgi:hypothetical protein
MSNPLDPALMSPVARRAEVAAILAAGFLWLLPRDVGSTPAGSVSPHAADGGSTLAWVVRPPFRAQGGGGGRSPGNRMVGRRQGGSLRLYRLRYVRQWLERSHRL